MNRQWNSTWSKFEFKLLSVATWAVFINLSKWKKYILSIRFSFLTIFLYILINNNLNLFAYSFPHTWTIARTVILAILACSNQLSINFIDLHIEVFSFENNTLLQASASSCIHILIKFLFVFDALIKWNSSKNSCYNQYKTQNNVKIKIFIYLFFKLPIRLFSINLFQNSRFIICTTKLDCFWIE